MNSRNNEDEFMTLDQEGKPQSLEDIYLIYKAPLYRFVYRYTSDRQLSIDTVQDTFEKFYKKRHHYDAKKGSVKTYLFQIAYNTMATKMKRRQKFRALLPFLAADQPSYSISLEEKISVQDAIQSLPEDQRVVVLLTYYHDLTQRGTARVLGIPVGTVKSRLHHALKKLKIDLEVDDDE